MKKNESPLSPLVDQYLFPYIQTVNGNIWSKSCPWILTSLVPHQNKVKSKQKTTTKNPRENNNSSHVSRTCYQNITRRSKQKTTTKNPRENNNSSHVSRTCYQNFTRSLIMWSRLSSLCLPYAVYKYGKMALTKVNPYYKSNLFRHRRTKVKQFK